MEAKRLSDSGHGTKGRGGRELLGAAAAAATATATVAGSSDDGAGNPLQQPGERSKDEAGGSSTAQPRIRRRNRMITSCLECRRRKMKCDRLHPCTNCSKSNRDCVFLAPATDAASRKRFAEVKEQMGHLEGSLGRDAAATGTAEPYDAARHNNDASAATALADRADSSQPDPKVNMPDDERKLRPTEMAVQDAVYEDEADDDTFDLGFKVGKMTMTDRIGGLFRPRLADELSALLDRLDLEDKDKNKEPVKESQTVPPRLPDLLPDSPSSSVPRSGLLFGNAKQLHSLADFLPSRVAADHMLARYWEAAHPIAKVVHRPTFERQYAQFWTDISNGLEPMYSLQSIVFAVLFAASITMSENMALSSFGVQRNKLVENFQLATEMALGKADFLKTTKSQTLQAFIVYMVPMCRDEISRAHSTLVGAGIRLAECMGLHRDPTEYEISPVETHVRRIIWFELCFLDIRTSDVQGPRPFIRPDDFTTKLPLNVDDSDFRWPPILNLIDRAEFTDMTLNLLRFECYELARRIHFDRMLVEKEAVGLTQIVGKIEAAKKAIYEKYGPMICVPDAKPIQRAAQLFLSMSMSSAYMKLLHPFLISVKVRIPDRLRQVIISAATLQMETAIALETDPELQPWAWYLGNYLQYHTAFLLLMEIFLYPTRREADRIWRCLDYIFETSPLPPHAANGSRSEISREEVLAHRREKAIYVIRQILDKVLALREVRKPKASVKMNRIVMRELPKDANRGGPAELAVFPQEDIASLHAPVIDLVRKSQERQTPGSSRSPLSTDTSYTQGLAVSKYASEQERSDTSFHGQSKQSSGDHRDRALDHSANHITLQQNYQAHTHESSFQPSAPMTYFPDFVSQHLGTHGSSFETTSSHQTPFMDSAAKEKEPSSSSGAFQPGNRGPSGVDTGNMAQHMPLGEYGAEDIPMLDIDWDEWDKLFPPEFNSGELNVSTLPETYSTVTTQVPLDGLLSNYGDVPAPMQDYSSFSYSDPSSFLQL